MAKTFVVFDFETVSACDLKVSGASAYAEHPSTDVLCLCFKVGGQQPEKWVPHHDSNDRLISLIRAGAVFVAHNAAFEKSIWKYIMVPRYGFPPIPLEQWHDTMAVCAMRAVPQKLDAVVRTLNLPGEKDMAGSRFTISLSTAYRKKGEYDRSKEALDRVVAYCHKDVEEQTLLHYRMGWLPPGERKVWLMDQLTNERGIGLDIPYIRACQKIITDTMTPLAAEFTSLTGLSVGQNAKIISWANGRGMALENLRKETIDDLLGSEDEEPDLSDNTEVRMPWEVRRALTIRRMIGSSSVKKLQAMDRVTNSDGRARYALNYHGTAPGRWAGRLFQPQNFPRPILHYDDPKFSDQEKADLVVSVLRTGDAEFVRGVFGDSFSAVITGLRHAIQAGKGKMLVAGDYAGIQARVVLALAGQHDKAAIMAAGKDIYCDMASQIYKRPIDKKRDPEERHIGKNAVLGLGFGMGAKKFFDNYCEGKGLEFSFIEHVIKVYRNEWAPMVPRLWRGLTTAATKAVWNPGTAYSHGPITYKVIDKWLTARLPSGRLIWYFDPIKSREAMPWDEFDIRASFTFKAWKNGRMKEVKAFGGLLTENVVMGIERDIMVDGWTKLEAAGFPVIMNVHDELVCEPDAAMADHKVMEQIMSDGPAWAKEMQIPIAVEGWTSPWYRK